MNQCARIMKNTTTLTLIISIVAKSAAPFVVWPNIDESILHAVGKSSALKKTHVTLTRKKVNMASKKLLNPVLFPSEGAIDAWTITVASTVCSGGFGLLTNFSRSNFSTHKYVPCNAPHTTNVQDAPCQRPPNNMVIIKLDVKTIPLSCFLLAVCTNNPGARLIA